MPYKNSKDLPKDLRNILPTHAQHIYKVAFNSAVEQYGEESTAHAVAWSAVKNKYKKNDSGKWVSKKSN